LLGELERFWSQRVRYLPVDTALVRPGLTAFVLDARTRGSECAINQGCEEAGAVADIGRPGAPRQVVSLRRCSKVLTRSWHYPLKVKRTSLVLAFPEVYRTE
jgi:hypothetical protein